MLYSSVEFEDAMSRILQMAYRVGIHVIFSANHLTTKFIPATIQSEIPNKLLFRFTSVNDTGSNRYSDVENLKAGEALFISADKPQKLDAVYTSEENVKEVVAAVKKQTS